MEPNEKYRQEEIKRLMEWIKTNGTLWETICDTNKGEISMVGFQSIIRILKNESFYQIILVLATVYKKQKFVETSLNEIFMELLIKDWDMEKGEEMVNRLIRLLN